MEDCEEPGTRTELRKDILGMTITETHLIVKGMSISIFVDTGTRAICTLFLEVEAIETGRM